MLGAAEPQCQWHYTPGHRGGFAKQPHEARQKLPACLMLALFYSRWGCPGQARFA